MCTKLYILKKREKQPAFIGTSSVVSSAGDSLFATDKLNGHSFLIDNPTADRSVTLADGATIKTFSVPLRFRGSSFSWSFTAASVNKPIRTSHDVAQHRLINSTTFSSIRYCILLLVRLRASTCCTMTNTEKSIFLVLPDRNSARLAFHMEYSIK